VIIPGGQALLGFQFIATLSRAFAELPSAAQIGHAAGLCAVALAVTLLMTPAAIHRIAFEGEDSGQFYRIASRIVIAATLPLAAGIAVDVGVVFLDRNAKLRRRQRCGRRGIYPADGAMAGLSVCSPFYASRSGLIGGLVPAAR